MIQGSNLELALFSDVPELDALETLYNLNQENTPEVGSLSSVNELRSLIQLSALNFFVLNEEEIIGFIICFREGSKYHSPNYKFFSDCEDKFLYIDRVVIKKEYRRMGAGTSLYEHLSKVANLENLPICCEVNTSPINQISLNFILGSFLNYMGGIPVDKTNPGKGLTEMAIKNMKKLNGSLIAMSPEGTRAKTEKFKTGFLRIAKAVEGKIFLASFDFDKKRIFLDTFFDPSGDNDLDLSYVKEYFTQFGAKRPENY